MREASRSVKSRSPRGGAGRGAAASRAVSRGMSRMSRWIAVSRGIFAAGAPRGRAAGGPISGRERTTMATGGFIRSRRGRAALLAAALACLAACAGPAGPGGDGGDARGGLTGVTAVGDPARRSAAPVPLRVIAFNDFHGQIEPGGLALRVPDPADPSRMLQVGAGGVAHLATLVRHLRAQVPHAVVVSAGDLVGASPIASALFRDEPTIEAMNAIGLDLGVVGNHEFDRGVAELERLIGGGCHAGDGSPAASCDGPGGHFAGARFPMIAANVHRADGRALLPASVVREVGGVRVAFVGAVLRATPTIVVPSGVAGLRFEDEAEAINREVAALKARGVEAVVAVIHEGGTIAGDWNDPSCPGARGPVFAIVDRLRPEVDAVLTGHSHQGYACLRDAPGNPRLPVVQAFANGRAVSVLDLELDPASGDVIRERTRARNLPVANGLAGDRAADRAFAPWPPDPAVAAIVDHYAARARPLAERPVGRIARAASRAPSAGGDSALGRLVADAQLAATRAPERGGARIALMNPGGLRADLRCERAAAPCTVRVADAFAAQPFGNALVVMTLTGARLLEALEQQFAGVNAGRPRPLQPSAGFEWAWRAGGAGPRIVEARLDGVPIDPAARYRVAVNAFLAEGGDGFEAFRAGTERLGGGLDLDALTGWLGAAAVVEPPDGARTRRVD
jgi:5'-nucleotidase